MKDDETLFDFFSRLCDTINESFALGERILESKLVWKIVRSLPDKFQSKVTTIKESKNLDTMKIELMGSLQTFELNLRQKKKDKSIALKSTQDESLDLEENDNDVALLTKHFNKFLKKMEKRPKESPKATKPPKGKNPFKPNVFANKNKGF